MFYKTIAIANEELEEEQETNQVTVSSSNLSTVLVNLNAFTKYKIEVLAFTVKGDGVKSIPIKAGNCCPTYSFANNVVSKYERACRHLGFLVFFFLFFFFCFLLTRSKSKYHYPIIPS